MRRHDKRGTGDGLRDTGRRRWHGARRRGHEGRGTRPPAPSADGCRPGRRGRHGRRADPVRGPPGLAARARVGPAVLHLMERHRRAGRDRVDRRHELRRRGDDLPAVLAGSAAQRDLAGLPVSRAHGPGGLPRRAARQGGPGQPLLPDRAVHARRPVAGPDRLRLAADLLARPGTAQRRPRHPDRLVRRSRCQPLGGAGGHGLAPHRLHHAAVPGRAEGRRPLAAGGGRGGRIRRGVDLLPDHPAGDATDQPDRDRRRGDRVAAGLRPGLGDQQGPQRARADRCAGDLERRGGGQPDRLRVGDGHDHAADLVGVHRHLPARRPEGGAVSTTATAPPASTTRSADQRRHKPLRSGHVVLQAFLILVAIGWLFPLGWAVLNSFRDYAYTSVNGYVSLGGWTLDNYIAAWERGEFGRSFLNSAIITVPAVLLALFLASCTAFVLSRFNYRFNLTLLGVFLAANLLPPQSLLVPVFQAYNEIPLPPWLSSSESMLGSFLGLILIIAAFQMRL